MMDNFKFKTRQINSYMRSIKLINKIIVIILIIFIFVFRDSIFYKEEKIEHDKLRINRITGNVQYLNYSGWHDIDKKGGFKIIPFDYYFKLPGKRNIQPSEIQIKFEPFLNGTRRSLIINNSDYHLDGIELKIKTSTEIINHSMDLDCKAWNNQYIELKLPEKAIYRFLFKKIDLEKLKNHTYLEKIKKMEMEKESFEVLRKTWNPSKQKHSEPRVSLSDFYRYVSSEDALLEIEYNNLISYGKNPNYIEIDHAIYEKRTLDAALESGLEISISAANGRKVIKSS